MFIISLIISLLNLHCPFISIFCKAMTTAKHKTTLYILFFSVLFLLINNFEKKIKSNAYFLNSWSNFLFLWQNGSWDLLQYKFIIQYPMNPFYLEFRLSTIVYYFSGYDWRFRKNYFKKIFIALKYIIDYELMISK